MNRTYEGLLTGSEMVKKLNEENKSITWILRILFTILVCMGFAMLFTPLTVLASSIPFLGKLFLGRLSKGIAGVIGGVIGVALSLLVIAIAWVVVRPLIGVPLLIVAIALIAGSIITAKKKTAKAKEQAPQTTNNVQQ